MSSSGPRYIRLDAAEMSVDAISRFCDAFAELKTRVETGSSVSILEEYTALHYAVTRLPGPGGDNAHRGPAFLPWHREYLYRFEEELRNIDSGVAIPYWNWSGIESPGTDTNEVSVPNSWTPQGVFNRVFTSSFIGSGGAPNNTVLGAGPVIDGGFLVNGSWTVPQALVNIGGRPQMFGTNLRRNTDLSPTNWQNWSNTVIGSVMLQTGYPTFRQNLESQAHDPGHMWVGGQMGTMISPIDPIFWLHHAEVDRIWAHWQLLNVQDENWDGTYVGADRDGHRIGNDMWPWDGGVRQPNVSAELQSILPTISSTDTSTVRSTLDPYGYGYVYESDHQGVAGLLARAVSACCQACNQRTND